MPRPKVLPQHRKRVSKACSTCRVSKKRCDGQQPCRNCVRRDIVESCVFENVSSSPVPSRTISGPDNGNDNVADGSTPTHTHQAQNISPATTAKFVSSPEASHRTQPRLLHDSRGEKVFFGGSASLAFLQLIRDTVSQSLESSEFSNHAERNHMFEEPHAQAIPVAEVYLSPEQESAFLDSFLVSTRGLVELHTKSQILEMLHESPAGRDTVDPLRLAIARTSLAIGAQCAVRDHENTRISRSYFAEAQRQAFAGMLEDPSIEMVQLFLLMSFYMLGACQRNAAFMYIGVAARGAYVLGLHYLSPATIASDEAGRVRRITWKCLFTLDTAVSSILGRPSATSTQHNHKQTSLAVTNGDLVESAAMQANFRLACLLDQRVQDLYSSDKITTEGARACLDQLSNWSTTLPLEVRLASDTIRSATVQEQVVGGLHVSCFYYFGVMLVSRPFLIVCVTNRLARMHCNAGTVSTGLLEADVEGEMQEIAHACLNAATYMIQTCIETQIHGFLPQNMRLLQAWIFAAGLVLGFEMFTVEQSGFEIEEAFHGSRKILEILSTHLSQAAHYLNILSSFSEAIVARRRLAVSSRRRTGKPTVEKIMAFQIPSSGQDISEHEQQSRSRATLSVPELAPVLSSGPHDTATDSTRINDVGPSFDFQDMFNEPFLNWDSSDFLAWDPFSHDLLESRTE